MNESHNKLACGWTPIQIVEEAIMACECPVKHKVRWDMLADRLKEVLGWLNAENPDHSATSVGPEFYQVESLKTYEQPSEELKDDGIR